MRRNLYALYFYANMPITLLRLLDEIDREIDRDYNKNS